MAAAPINDPDTPADPRAADTQCGSLLHAAMLAVNAGYFVFPVRPGGKEPALDKDWEGQATRDRVVVRRWWRRTPHNFGIAAGPSGVVVVDLDDGHGATAPEPFAGARHGLEVLARLAARAGAEVPTDTFTVLTPSVIHGRRQGLFTVHSEGGQPVPGSSHHGYLGVFFARIRRRRCGAAGAPDGRANRSRLAVS